MFDEAHKELSKIGEKKNFSRSVKIKIEYESDRIRQRYSSEYS